MRFSAREAVTALHGMVFGFGYLLFFTGAIVLLLTLRPGLLTDAGVRRNVLLLRLSALALALLAWLAVIVGTFLVYPWYRAAPPAGTVDLTAYARSRLLSDAQTSGWHSFGMEWKEHVTWLVPILATATTFIVFRYGSRLLSDRLMNGTVIVLLLVAFAVAGAGGLLGALITKAAPVL